MNCLETNFAHKIEEKLNAAIDTKAILEKNKPAEVVDGEEAPKKEKEIQQEDRHTLEDVMSTAHKLAERSRKTESGRSNYS